jgi:predicted peptidase
MTPTPDGIISSSQIWVVKPDEGKVVPVEEAVIEEEQEDDLPKL